MSSSIPKRRYAYASGTIVTPCGKSSARTAFFVPPGIGDIPGKHFGLTTVIPGGFSNDGYQFSAGLRKTQWQPRRRAATFLACAVGIQQYRVMEALVYCWDVIRSSPFALTMLPFAPARA
ncbi:hypothetical protein [Paraburkholderia sp.]|uniref:hypothetical protein n=1 Tax=Paraburkholderia sp. TaxID=1926495 RepID=UPI002D59203D|nr:hypothetical protein [Paraburkholderia sp.]HZZ02751.1 hypothetical protein [Paraburkholderia sp.]